MLLSPDQHESLVALNQYYMQALDNRVKNPADFDTNITFLNALADVVSGMKTIFKQEMKQVANRDMSQQKYDALMQEAHSILIDEKLSARIKEVFAADERITSMDAHLSSSKVSQGMFVQKKEKINFTIKFKDDSKLEFTSTDAAVAEKLEMYKEHYTRKMGELANEFKTKRHRS